MSSSPSTDPKYHYVQLNDAIITLTQLSNKQLPVTVQAGVMSGWRPAANAASTSIGVLQTALGDHEVPPGQTDEIQSLITSATMLLDNPPKFSVSRPAGASDGNITWTDFAPR